MKKVFLLGLSCLFFFAGCDNFGDQSQLKEKLNSEIEYSRAPSFDVSFHLEKSSQGVVTRSVDSAKVGYPFELGVNIDEDEWYFDKKWSLTDENGLYLTESEYSVTESASNTYIFTVYKKVSELEIIPVCNAQPSVYCGVPYYVESENVKGSVTPFGKTKQVIGKNFTVQYNLNSSDYTVKEIQVKKDGVTLTKSQSKEIIDFGEVETSAGIYKQTLNLKSCDADGVVLEPLVVSTGNNYSDSAPQIIDCKVSYSEAFNSYYPFKTIDSCTEFAKDKNFYLRLKTDKEVTRVKIIERCVKLTDDMLVQDINKKWTETDKNGKLMFNSYGDFIATDYDKDNFVLVREIDESNLVTSVDASGNYLTTCNFKFDLKTGGIHQWSFIAINSNGESKAWENDFTGRMVNDTAAFWKNNKEFMTYDVTTTMYTGAEYVTDYIVYGLNGYRHNPSDRIFIKAQSSINERELITDTMVDLCGGEINTYASSTSAGTELLIGKGPWKKWKIDKLSRDTAYKLSMCWVNEYGYKGTAVTEIVNTQKAMPLDVGLYQENVSSKGYIEFVTYMTYEDYKNYVESGGNKLKPFGVVVSASNKHIYLMNLTEPSTNYQLCKATITSSNTVLYNIIGKSDYSGAELQEEMVNNYGLNGNVSLSYNYPGFNYAKLYGKKASDSCYCLELNWFIPTFSEFYNMVTHDTNFVDDLNKVLEGIGETKLSTPFRYWTSTITSASNAQLPYKQFNTTLTTSVTSTDVKIRLLTDAIDLPVKFFE